MAKSLRWAAGMNTLVLFSTLLVATAGVPLLIVGATEQHAGGRVIIDSMGPRAMPGGGGMGISGRF